MAMFRLHALSGSVRFGRNWCVIKGGFDAICSHLPDPFSVFLWSRFAQVADIAAVRPGVPVSQFHNRVFSVQGGGGTPGAGMPGGKSACGAGDAGEGFEEIGDNGGDGCVALGSPDAGLAVGLLGNGYGDVFVMRRLSGTEWDSVGNTGTLCFIPLCAGGEK